MNVQEQIRTAPSDSTRAFRRHYRGRRHLRGGRCLPSDHAMSGDEFRRPRDAEQLWRNLAHAPLSRHPLRQRPAYLRLPVQALDQRADRDRRGDSQLHGRGDRGKRTGPPHPLWAHHFLGALVEPGKSLDHRGRQNRHRRGGSLHREFLLDVPGLLPPRGRLYARVEGDGRASRAGSSIRRNGPTISTTKTRTSL